MPHRKAVQVTGRMTHDLSHALTIVYKHSSTRVDIHIQVLALNSKPNSLPLTPCVSVATTMEAWAMTKETSVAWALAVAMDVAASAGWAMALALEAMDLALAMEALDMATITTHPSLEDMDSVASTEILSQEPNM